MHLTCGIGLRRAKTSLKSFFQGRKDLPEDSRRQSSSSTRRKSKLLSGSKSSDGVSAQVAEVAVPESSARKVSHSPAMQIEEQKREPDEDITSAVLSAGSGEDRQKNALRKSSEVKKAGIQENVSSPTAEAPELSHRPQMSPNLDAGSAKGETKGKSSEASAQKTGAPTNPCELSASDTNEQKPNSREIEAAEVEEAKAAVRASEFPGSDSAGRVDQDAAQEQSEAIKTAVNQSGAGGSLMGMSATSGPLSDQPALG